ncbi:carboxyl-terminal protease [Pseudobdellovibrio exovorus JSS]|uniref:Carboxyl-terminal protease n=2 Tax=Pseudobdellovibrio exovorus TaxID=453816 RepID=M4VEK0_9BACT|nr:carboxyl-terminal protease [Pseudobdellovibrio exovorus JSS]
MVLAGIGGLSAKTIYFFDQTDSSEKQKIEAYWDKTALGFSEVSEIINNQKCNSSAGYYKACLAALSQSALLLQKQVDLQSGRLVDVVESDYLVEKNEKDLMSLYAENLTSRLDFEKELQELIQGAKKDELKSSFYGRMINAFLSVYADPHTYVLPLNFYSNVGSKMDRSKFFVGISYEKLQGDFYIRRVSKNSDAELAGIRVGDKVLSVDSIDLKGLSYSEFSDLMTNEEKTGFVFVVQRGEQTLNLKLQRTYRQLNHVQYSLIKSNKNYAYVNFTKFGSGACLEIARAIQTAREEKVGGMILDLRDNAGGQMEQAACIAGLFLGKNKKAYYVEYFSPEQPNEVALTSEEQLYDGPLVVLINSSSASSSELLAGALQEYGRALIVGERSFGKGTFQEPESWKLNPKVTLYKTQGFYLLPSRNSTQLRGVVPDVVIEDNEHARREENLYLNPLKAEENLYAGLAEREKVRAYSYPACDSVGTLKGTSNSEDSYLATAVQHLGCVQPWSSSLAEQKAHSIN